METLGTRVRHLRHQEHLSLREFARLLNCSAAFISDVELGRRYPSDKMLADIARILRTTIEELKRHDIRPPIEDIKKAAARNPRYAIAFRTILDNNVSPEELLQFAKSRDRRVMARKRAKD